MCSLGGNELKDEGAKHLCDALKVNKTLATLSLANNALCGINKFGDGTYTTEGITELCEGLKGSAVTSLKYAVAR